MKKQFALFLILLLLMGSVAMGAASFTVTNSYTNGNRSPMENLAGPGVTHATDYITQTITTDSGAAATSIVYSELISYNIEKYDKVYLEVIPTVLDDSLTSAVDLDTVTVDFLTSWDGTNLTGMSACVAGDSVIDATTDINKIWLNRDSVTTTHSVGTMVYVKIKYVVSIATAQADATAWVNKYRINFAAWRDGDD